MINSNTNSPPPISEPPRTPVQEPPRTPVQEPQRTPAQERQRERKRRRNEIMIAAGAFFVVLILTSVQLDQFRTGDRLFVVMFNINFVLLVGVLLVVLRNGIKLLLERRRKVLGSKLRTKLVFAFFTMSLLPCLLMFLVTTKYVQLSIDFWFKDQVETSMETALDVARSMYENSGNNLSMLADNTYGEIKERKFVWGGQGMDSLLQKKRKDHMLALVELLPPDGSIRGWKSSPDSIDAWEAHKESINWEALKTQKSLFTLMQGPERDYIFSIIAIDAGRSGYLLFAEDLGAGFKNRMDRIAKGAGEYKNLRKAKQPLKLMLYSSLGVLTTLIVFGAVWFGFRVSREISTPVLALAAGTEAIAKGNLSVRLSDSSGDELGMLIRSFNIMAEDLEQGQRKITGANAMLEEQNQRINRHNKYIETILNSIAAGVISFDQTGCINTVNKAACEILDITDDKLVGQQVESLFPESHVPLATSIRERFGKRLDLRAQHNVRLRVGGEEKRLLINVVGFSTEGIYQGAVAVFEDISELERMQRVAAWREVARRIAHEIKNPLTPIKLSAQRLARKFGKEVSDPAFIQSTELIVRQVEHLQNMVQEFSAFAKLPEVKPVPDDLPALLQFVTALFANSHSGITWKLQVAPSLPQVAFDKDAMHRALINIYTNAAEALEQSCAPNPFVYINAEYNIDSQMVQIDIADNGPGLTEDERMRLFEPYFSHKKGGTGLGLAIVRSIVTDHRGYVRALPREGGGTILSIELPLV